MKTSMANASGGAMVAPDAFADVPLHRVFHSGRLPAQLVGYDLCVVGSGPGGSTVAAMAASLGYSTLLVEEGPFARAQDFAPHEPVAAKLYQDHMSRRTADGAITVLQGRTTGGSSTLNWTSSFRAPKATLEHWGAVHGLSTFVGPEFDAEFDAVEKYLGVTPWTYPNPNNEAIARGCESLGWHWAPIPRNVRGCWNLGLCGLGCPTNAKQSALVTSVKDMLLAGGSLVADARAEKIVFEEGRAVGVRVSLGGQPVVLRSRVVVVSCGAIGTPALLLRSGLGEQNPNIGTRTFLHPVVTSFAKFAGPVNPWEGAPQSVHSDQFLWPGADQDVPGFKIETMPLLPMFAAGLAAFHGETYRRTLGDLAHVHGAMALQRDGFDDRSPGGQVTIDSLGRPQLGYEVTAYQFEGFRRALLALAEMQFAAGASEVIPVHLAAKPCRSMSELKTHLAQLPMVPHALRIGSAHVMGGCRLSPDPARGVTNLSGAVHGVSGLYVADGSLFPTSLGVNPQLTVYALARRLARGLLNEKGFVKP